MAVANPIGTYHPYQSTGFEGRGRPEVKFDDNVPAGTDPMALWRLQNSQKSRRSGSTAAERAGGVAGYTPGYGRASNQNSNGASSLTNRVDWDAHFTPRLGEQMRIAREGENTMPPSDRDTTGARVGVEATSATTPPVTPGTGIPSPGPALPPATTPPILPPSPGAVGATPQIQQINGTQSAVRQVTGLPTGQYANASIVPGQNDIKNMPNSQVQQAATRGRNVSGLPAKVRPPVDPYA